jgi:hypothetical protein
MTKIKLCNSRDFENLLIQLKEDDGTELSFQNEENPTSFPCLAVHHYSDDSDLGNTYIIEFIYLTDFNVMTKEEQIEAEFILLDILKNESLKMLERVENNKTYPNLDFKRAKEVIQRTYEDKLFELKRGTEEYYKDFISYYYPPYK